MVGRKELSTHDASDHLTCPGQCVGSLATTWKYPSAFCIRMCQLCSQVAKCMVAGRKSSRGPLDSPFGCWLNAWEGLHQPLKKLLLKMHLKELRRCQLVGYWGKIKDVLCSTCGYFLLLSFLTEMPQEENQGCCFAISSSRGARKSRWPLIG